MRYSIYFEGKTEYFLSPKKVEQYPLGGLLFAFLDADWAEMHKQANDLRAKMETDENCHFLVCPFYQGLCSSLEKLHPMLRQFIVSNLEETIEDIFKDDLPIASDYAMNFFSHYPNKPVTPELYKGMFYEGPTTFPLWPFIKVAKRFVAEIITLLDQLASFKDSLSDMILFALDENGSYNDLTAARRLYLMQAAQAKPYAEAKALYTGVGIEQQILASDEIRYEKANEITEELLEKIKAANVAAYTFYTSLDIRALVMLEFEYMCVNNHNVRKCANCGRYFLPFSLVSRYCDRPVEGKGKTCKDLGANAKYNEKVNGDDLMRIYRRLNNTYQMRCSRAPGVYLRADYEAWQENAKSILENVKAGKIPVDEFEEMIRIPDKKG